MVTLASETWTGTTGAAWPAQWVAGVTGGTGTATIQANAGRLAPSAGGYGDFREFLNGMSAATDTELVVSWNMGVSAVEQIVIFSICSDNTQGINQFSGLPRNGFSILVWYGASSTTTADISLWRDTGSTEAQLNNRTLVALTGTTNYTLRFQRTGTTVRYRIWATAGSEPATWDVSVTDATALSGKVGLDVANGSNGTQRFATFDNLTVTDGATAGGTHTTSRTATATAAATAVTSKRATVARVASALAGASVVTAGQHASVRTASATASANGATSSSRSTSGTAPGKASASAATTATHPTTVAAPATASAGGATASTRVTQRDATAHTQATAATATTRATIGTGTAHATATGVTGGVQTETHVTAGNAVAAASGAAATTKTGQTTGTGQASSTASATTATSRRTTATSYAIAATFGDTVTLRYADGIALAHAYATATSSNPSGYRDITVTLGAVRGNPLQVAGPTANRLTVHTPTGHPIQARTLTGHNLEPSTPTGHPLHAGPVRN